MNIKHYELVAVADEFLKYYNMELDIPIEFNSRIKRVLGRFVFTKTFNKYTPLKIEMSLNFIMNYPREHIIDVLKHELVHYVLCRQKLPFFDGDAIFENELKLHGINRTHTYKYFGEVHKYQCTNCGSTVERKRKLGPTAYCGCSLDNNLKYLGSYTKIPQPTNPVTELYGATGTGVCHYGGGDLDGNS